MIGLRFGRLVVVEKDSVDKKQGVKWRCLCDCGNEAIVIGSNLRNGHTQSCNHCGKDIIQNKKYGATHNRRGNRTQQNYVDLTGQRFGKLVAVEPTDKRSGGSVVWKCVCDCGSEHEVSSNCLRQGYVVSCGCIVSKGENAVAQILQNNNIKFKQQYSRDDCRRQSTDAKFRFDFAIFDDSDNLLCVIEYNGSQHYKYSGSGWDTKENFLETVARDQEKEELCKQLNIPLYVIRYDQNIEEELDKILTYENFM